MGISMLDLQREAVLNSVRDVGRGQWKVLVVDAQSWRLISNAVKEDEILSEKITNIEHIEQKRNAEPEMDAIYLLSPEPHIVDCLMSDFDCKKYRSASVLWTSLLHASLRKRIDGSRAAQQQIQLLQVLDVGFYPRESQLITLRDPWSFPILFHPTCNNLVRQHIAELAQKIVSVCVSLGEYPTIRYYRPRASTHEASVLCSHLARFVQEEIDMYATYHSDFPPPSNRPRAMLYIVDRSMDLVAPLVHEFTYQAMVHDLLPVRDGDKTTYQIKVNEGRPNQEAKDAEISEKDKIWVANRHQHMKDTIDKLMGEFQKFIDANPHFANSDQDNANSLSAIKDMLAGLPQFQEMKEAYSLHLTMAQEAMNIFQQRKLPDLASVEQSLATGFDEDHKKPKNVADQIVRLLDEESVTPPDRLRLIILYILYRDGILPADLEKLISHAQLAQSDGEVVRNLGFLGARISKQLKETRAPPQPLFVQVPSNISPQEEYSLSRFETNLKLLLKDHVKGVLDQEAFPYTKPQLDAPEPADSTAQASLRSAKPTWARGRSSATEPRQRIIVFMAGGATFSESRACYEVTQETNKDVYLLTSHMLTPSLFMRQLGDLSVDKRRLMIPAEQPKPKAPAHVFEPEPAPAAPAPPAGGHRTKAAAPPTAQMQHMNLGASNGARPTNGHVLPSPNLPQPPPTLQQTRLSAQQGSDPSKKKKHLGLFGSKK